MVSGNKNIAVAGIDKNRRGFFFGFFLCFNLILLVCVSGAEEGVFEKEGEKPNFLRKTRLFYEMEITRLELVTYALRTHRSPN